MVEKVTDIDQITAFGVMMTPALAIDGQVKAVGKVLSRRGNRGAAEMTRRRESSRSRKGDDR